MPPTAEGSEMLLCPLISLMDGSGQEHTHSSKLRSPVGDQFFDNHESSLVSFRSIQTGTLSTFFTPGPQWVLSLLSREKLLPQMVIFNVSSKLVCAVVSQVCFIC